MTQPSIYHTAVYREAGRFAGWPANFGMWAWGNEIVVVFTEGGFENRLRGHKADPSVPFRNLQGRSLDGGETWSIEPFNGATPKSRALASDAHMIPELGIGNPYEGENPPQPRSDPIDFTDAETVVMLIHTTHAHAPGRVHSWFHLSRDRCRSWQGPFSLRGLDPSIESASRTDVVPLSPDRALFLLTVQKSNGHEGRVLCAETCDGGRTYRIKAPLGGEPERFEIMPSSVRLDSGRLLTAVRREEADRTPSIRVYASSDDGASWKRVADAVPTMGERGSNPPAMVRTKTGRLALVYGYRSAPFGMRAVVSDDEGKSWSTPIVLRSDGGDGDLGYPRAVLRSDGKLVTCYYFNEHTDGERFIGATIWDVDGADSADSG